MKLFCSISSAVLVAALVVVGSAHAGAIDQLRAFSASTKTARGDFTQRIVSRTQKVSVPNSGDFIFARPGKFRWVYQKPYEQVLVADGEKLVIYDKDLNQVTTRKLSEALGSTPAAVLFGSGDIEKQFDLKEAGTKDGIEWLDAIPKSKETNFERIGIGFRNGELAAMELRDVLGQVTMLTFANLQRNPNVPADAFKFTPPAGADILDN